jgi:nucleotide-binding universal stress UspA family protein
MEDRGPILVALDGSELAEGVLPVATAVARAERTHLVLVTVWGDTGASLAEGTAVELERTAREHFEAYLHGVRERLGQPEARTIVRGGDPAAEILAAAAETGARMVVAGSHGRSGIGRWLYGSTTFALLRESELPLLVVGPAALRRGGEFALRRIMVPLDGSPQAEGALPVATRLAERAGARVDLVRVCAWAVQAYPFALEGVSLPALDRELEDAAKAYIERSAAATSANVAAEGHVLRGATADALLSFEQEHKIDLAVMTTRARGGLARAALGSTADRLVHGVAPVLLVRTTGGG